MIRNYFLASFRSLSRHKASVLMNLLSLVLGFSCFIVIGTYVKKELEYDQHHDKADRIYRVTHNEKAGEVPGIRHLATVGPPVGPALKESFSQVEDAVRFRYTSDRIIRHKDVQYYENRIYYVDPSVFNIFDFPLASGDPATALLLPNSVVITQGVASKYFGDENALGKTLTMDGNTELVVTGVLEPLPDNIHLKFDFLLPFEAFKVPFGYPVTLNDWGWSSFHTYIMLREGEDAGSVEHMLADFVKGHWTPERAKLVRMELQPLKAIYLGEVKHDQVAAGNKTYIIVLTLAALLILFTAAFNFANLFTATSAARAKEIGIRKVIGAKKSSLVFQLVFEAMLISIGAGVITFLLLPVFTSALSTMNVSIHLTSQEYAIAAVVLFVISITAGSFSAIYPSLSLSSFDPHKLLKGSFKTGKTGVYIRRTFIIAQFTVSIALIASVFIISEQMKFLKTKDLGYAKNELLLLRMPGDLLPKKFPLLKNELTRNSNVTMVSVGGGRMDGDTGNVRIYTESTEDTGMPMSIDAITFDFFKTIGIQMVSGREFTEEQPADTLSGVIINQSAARQFGWTDAEAIGKRIRVGNILMDGEVIGVTPDFHFGSLHSAIAPIVMYYPRTRLQDIYIRFNTNDIAGLIQAVKNDWDKTVPELPFDFVLLSDHLQSLYQSETFFAMLFRLFGVIAIVIACLGLYGLISQDVIYRVKEIGIRKVLGASVSGITILLLRQFVVLIVLANVIAWPLSWVIMQNWLSVFTYHIEINWLLFPLAAMITIIIAVLSIGSKTIAAAMNNPVDSLRNE